MYKFGVIRSVLVWGLLGLPLAAQAIDIPAFHQVSEGIYRGARPGTELVSLAQMGIKTDLNLDNDTQVIASEGELAQSLGMQYLSRPMSGFWSPDDARIADVLGILADPANYPIYVHCQFGEDRTGLVVGLFRYYQQDWSAQAAHDEMLADGFHTALVFLEHYFWDHIQDFPRQ